METRTDGMLIYDDQLMEMAEGILRAEGLRETYHKRKNHSWIGKTEDEGLTAGLEELNEVQIRIIELIFFEGSGSVPNDFGISTLSQLLARLLKY